MVYLSIQRQYWLLLDLNILLFSKQGVFIVKKFGRPTLLGVSILQQVRARRDVAVWVKKGRCGSRVERLDIDNLEAAL